MGQRALVGKPCLYGDIGKWQTALHDQLACRVKPLPSYMLPGGEAGLGAKTLRKMCFAQAGELGQVGHPQLIG
jgi:hypothetical protein